GQPGAQRFVFFSAFEEMLRRLERGDLLRAQGGGELRHRHLVQRAHSITFGTRNRPRSTAGALRWFASRWLPSLTTSSRRRNCTSWTAATGCDSGSTPRVSTARIF